MIDPASLTTAINNASKVANTPLFTTIIDKITGFKISQWAAEGDLRKKIINDEYENAKKNGMMGIQFIENLRNTTNLIDTAVKSIKYIDQNKSNDIKMDNDFFWNTLEHAKTISNDEMQEFIARIIAGEYNEPGTYSMCTLQTIKMLGKTELDLLEKFGSLCINEYEIPEQIFTMSKNSMPILNELGVDFGTLQDLQSLGLILPNDMSRNIDNPQKKNFNLSYFDKSIIFEPINEINYTITLPTFYRLSKTGMQIIKHLHSKFIESYFRWLKYNYHVDNYIVKN